MTLGKLERAKFKSLLADAEVLRREMDALLPSLALARRSYAQSRSDVDQVEVNRVQRLAENLLERQTALSDEMVRVIGLSEQDLAELEKPIESLDSKNRLLRQDLDKSEVKTTGFVDRDLELAIENVERILPRDWSAKQTDVPHRLERLISGSDCLSLVKGLRPESELSDLHRLRQMLRVGKDYLTNEPAFDHFAGALLVPQLTQLGTHLRFLKDVGGDVSARLRKLNGERWCKYRCNYFRAFGSHALH